MAEANRARFVSRGRRARYELVLLAVPEGRWFEFGELVAAAGARGVGRNAVKAWLQRMFRAWGWLERRYVGRRRRVKEWDPVGTVRGAPDWHRRPRRSPVDRGFPGTGTPGELRRVAEVTGGCWRSRFRGVEYEYRLTALGAAERAALAARVEREVAELCR